MSNVIIDKNKIDLLANAIASKSGESVPMTLDEMVETVDGMVTPTGNIDITQAGVTDVASYATATVPEANPLVDATASFYTESNQRKFQVTPNVNVGISYGHDAGYLDVGTYVGSSLVFSAIPTGRTVTPTESAQTIGSPKTMMEGAVTVNAIPSNYVGTGITRRSSSDLTASGATVTVPSGYYSSQATKSVASGTAGTPTATKGTVSNHAVSVTPSVTNTTGYITGSTKTGTAVTVSASELVSGSETKTANGTYDVTNLAELVVNVSGGGGKNAQVVQSATRTTSTSYTKLCGDITVAKTGTYDVYWTGYRSSTSGTWGTQLYIGSTAYGTTQTTFSNHVQTVHLSNVSLTANQKVSVYGRSRGSNYYAYVGMLTIIES